MKILIVVTFVFCIMTSCKNKSDVSHPQSPTTKISEERLADIKWYFYAYALSFKAYDTSMKEIPILSCEVAVRRCDTLKDNTQRYLISAYLKNVNNECSFRPLSLVGISVVDSNIFLPRYHLLEFDALPDSVILSEMNRYSKRLLDTIPNSPDIVNPWLIKQAARRTVFTPLY